LTGLRQIRQDYRGQLAGLYPPEEIDHIFNVLLEHYLGLPRITLAMEPGKTLSEKQAQPLLDALNALKAHQPVQYLTGRAPFMGMDLLVTPAVLIPRPETEELVLWILEFRGVLAPGCRFMDVGTGSGCIALALKQHLPSAEGHAMDVSETALEVARTNAATLGLELVFHLKDLRTPGGEWPQFDLLVSNPPYVPLTEKDRMMPHVARSEPHTALFVPDTDPLVMYRHLARFGALQLKTGGWIFLEVHEAFGNQVAGLLEGAGFADVVMKKDIFGKDRFVRGRWPGPMPGAPAIGANPKQTTRI
jgi:release factor glutamine methyltransferase